jgi:hypothetical protein
MVHYFLTFSLVRTLTDNLRGMFRDKYGIEWVVEFAPNYNGQI